MQPLPPKIGLSAHEVMVLVGGHEPKVSSQLKHAMDLELAKPEYANLPSKKAWTLVVRYLAVNRPEAFDRENPDDLAVQKLFPLMVSPTGRMVPGKQLFSKLDMSNVALTHEIRGEDLRLSITAADKSGPAKTVRYKTKLKLGADKAGLPQFGVHDCRNPR